MSALELHETLSRLRDARIAASCCEGAEAAAVSKVVCDTEVAEDVGATDARAEREFKQTVIGEIDALERKMGAVTTASPFGVCAPVTMQAKRPGEPTEEPAKPMETAAVAPTESPTPTVSVPASTPEAAEPAQCAEPVERAPVEIPIPTFGTDRAPVSYRAKPARATAIAINTRLIERGPAIHTAGEEPTARVFTAVAHEVDAHTFTPVFEWPVHTAAQALEEVEARIGEHTRQTMALRVDADKHRARGLKSLRALEEKLEQMEASFEAAEAMETKEAIVERWSKTLTAVLKEADACGVLPPKPRVSLVARLATEKLPFARHLQTLASGPLNLGFSRFERLVQSLGDTMDVEGEWELQSTVLDLRHYMNHVGDALKMALEAENAGLPPTEITDDTKRYLKHVNETLVAHGDKPLTKWEPNMVPRRNPFPVPQETEVRPGKEPARGGGGSSGGGSSGNLPPGFDPSAPARPLSGQEEARSRQLQRQQQQIRGDEQVARALEQQEQQEGQGGGLPAAAAPGGAGSSSGGAGSSSGGGAAVPQFTDTEGVTLDDIGDEDDIFDDWDSGGFAGGPTVQRAVLEGTKKVSKVLRGENTEDGYSGPAIRMTRYRDQVLEWYESDEAKQYFAGKPNATWENQRNNTQNAAKTGEEYRQISKNNFKAVADNFIDLLQREKLARDQYFDAALKGNSDISRAFRTATKLQAQKKQEYQKAQVDYQIEFGNLTRSDKFKNVYDRYQEQVREWRKQLSELSSTTTDEGKFYIRKFEISEDSKNQNTQADKKWRESLNKSREASPADLKLPARPMLSNASRTLFDALSKFNNARKDAKAALTDAGSALLAARKQAVLPYHPDGNGVSDDRDTWSAYDEYHFRRWCAARSAGGTRWTPPYMQEQELPTGERQLVERSYYSVMTDGAYMQKTPMLRNIDTGRYSWGVAHKDRRLGSADIKYYAAFTFVRHWPKITNMWDGNPDPVSGWKGMIYDDPNRGPHQPKARKMRGQKKVGKTFSGELFDSTENDPGSPYFDDSARYVPFQPWEKDQLTETGIDAVRRFLCLQEKKKNAHAALKNAQTEYWMVRIGVNDRYIKTQVMAGGREAALAARDCDDDQLGLIPYDFDTPMPDDGDDGDDGASSALVPIDPAEAAAAAAAAAANPEAVRVRSNTTVAGVPLALPEPSEQDGGSSSERLPMATINPPSGGSDGGSSGKRSRGDDDRGGKKITATRRSTDALKDQADFGRIMKSLSVNAAQHGASLDHWRKIMALAEAHLPQAHVINNRTTEPGTPPPYAVPSANDTGVQGRQNLKYRRYTDLPHNPTAEEVMASHMVEIPWAQVPQAGTIHQSPFKDIDDRLVYEFLGQDGLPKKIEIPPYAIVFDQITGHVHMWVSTLYKYHRQLFDDMLRLLREYDAAVKIGDAELRKQDPTDKVFGQSQAVGRSGLADRLSIENEAGNELPTRRVPVESIRGGDTLPVQPGGMVFQFYEGSTWHPIIGVVPYMWDDERNVWVPRAYDWENAMWRSATWEPKDDTPMLSVEAAQLFPRAMIEYEDPSNEDLPLWYDYSYRASIEFESVELNGQKWYPGAPPGADPRLKFSDNRYYGLRDHETGAWRLHASQGRLRSFAVFDGVDGGVVDSMMLQEELDWIDQARRAHRPYYKMRLPNTLASATAVERHLVRFWQESEPYALGARNRELYSATEIIDVQRGSPEVEAIEFKLSNARAKELGIVYSNDPRVCERSARHLRGEPPPNDGVLSMWWIMPKPGNAYQFKDVNGVPTGAVTRYKDCFGVWDPLNAEWRLYPERAIVKVDSRTAPFGAGYGTYPGERPGGQILNREVVFEPVPPADQPLYIGTALQASMAAYAAVSDDLLGRSAQGWGRPFAGGRAAIGMRPPRERKILSMREELTLAPASRVRYYTPLLRHLNADPGVLAANQAEILDAKGAPRKMLVPRGFYALGSDGMVLPDLCADFSAPPTHQNFVRQLATEEITPLAEFNQTNEVIVFPMDPSGARYYASPGGGFLQSERERDEYMSLQNFSRTMVLPKWLKAPPTEGEDEIRRLFATDPILARIVARAAKYTIPRWAEPRADDPDSEASLRALFARDPLGFAQTLEKYNMPVPSWANSVVEDDDL